MIKKMLKKVLSSQRGFTLIELLVVIGILGILAAGLLAAIDPLEQLKKGRDTQKRNIAVELNNAATRYYAINGQMPWDVGGNPTNFGPTALNSMTTPLQTLIDVGELKTEFLRGLPAGAGTSITVTALANGAVYVCFNPESKSISSDPSTIYTNLGGGGNAPTTSATTCTPTQTCYWCAR